MLNSTHRKNIFSIKAALRLVRGEDLPAKAKLKQMLDNGIENQDRYSSHLHSESVWPPQSKEVAPTYDPDAKKLMLV